MAELKCSMKFPHPDGAEAVELLLVARVVGDDWSARPRCAQHPAADSISMLKKVDPTIRCAVVPVAPPPEARMREALALIGPRCQNYTSGVGSCWRNGRSPTAKYGADRCCDGCLAAYGLGLVEKQPSAADLQLAKLMAEDAEQRFDAQGRPVIDDD